LKTKEECSKTNLKRTQFLVLSAHIKRRKGAEQAASREERSPNLRLSSRLPALAISRLEDRATCIAADLPTCRSAYCLLLFLPLVFPRPLPNNGDMLTRNNIRLTLEGARAVLAAAESKARQIKVPQNIAIVDEGGHLLVFARMDGAKLSSIEVALTKARAAALRRAPTGPSPSMAEPSVLLSLGLPLATGGKLTCIRGGLPLAVDGQWVGGIGVSAGTEEQDVEVAQAGVEALARFS